jgi:hypothetical protein
MGVTDAVFAHRSEQHAGELSVTAAAHHDEIRPTRRFDQCRGGMIVDDDRSDDGAGVRPAGFCEGVLEDRPGVGLGVASTTAPVSSACRKAQSKAAIEHADPSTPTTIRRVGVA